MTLAPAQLAELSALLEVALELPAAGRRDWLDSLPDGQQSWRPLLQQLLEEHADAPTEALLTQLPQWSRQVAQRLQPEAQAGDIVGPYRLLRPLGRGGMGAVWLAERVDGTLKRQVALKLPLAGAAAPGRFVHERDILAALEHRHIARLYDAGISPDGQPYLALEQVVGQPITQHCEARALRPRERVALFLQVLQAVQYAHARLVIHRDLKPSNILVTDEGQVLLLDFGIATLLQADARADDGSLAAAMTPAYASPEQRAGQPLGTASDLYALGIVLQELISGQRFAEPRSPLPGDLEAIVAKALMADPLARYASAEAFAQDLRHWLAGEPVQARPGGLAYRSRRFILRNKLAVAAATLTVGGLALGLLVALHQARVAREQGLLAQRQAARAQAVQNFVVDLFNEADPVRAQGRELAVRDLLARGERTVQARLGGEPDLNIAMTGVLAEIYHRLGDDPRALPLAQARADLALQTHGPASLDYADALLPLAQAHAELQHYAAALELLQRARPLLASFGPQRQAERLAVEVTVASQLSNLRRHAEARATLQAALPGLQAWYGAASWELLKARSALATTYADEDAFDEAAAIDRTIEPLLDHVAPEHALDAAELRGEIGHRYAKARRWPDALRLLRASLAQLDRLLGPNNSSSIWALETLADAQLHAGDIAAATASAEANAQRAQLFYRDNDANRELTQSMAVVPLLLSGRLAEAEAIGRRAAQGAASGRGLSASLVMRVQRRCALALLVNGKAGEALALLDGIGEREAAAHIEDDRHALTLLYRAGALNMLGRAAEAAATAHEAAAIYQRERMPERVAKAWLTEAVALSHSGQAAQAGARVDEAERLFATALAPQHGDLQLVDWARAELLRAEGQATLADQRWAAARARYHDHSGGSLPQQLPLAF